jgi:hypothetical protein
MNKKKENFDWTWFFIVALVFGFFFLLINYSFEEDQPTNTGGSSIGIPNSYEDSYDWEEYYGDDWPGYLQGKLEEEGYEVINLLVIDVSSSTPMVTYFNDRDKLNCNPQSSNCILNKRTINIEMKSLGSRPDQIFSVLTNSVLIENLYGFWIEILSPTDTCVYVIKWDDYISCLDNNACNIIEFVSEDSLLGCE